MSVKCDALGITIKHIREDFEKPVKPENELTLVYKELNTLRSWREVNRNPLDSLITFSRYH